MKKQYIPERGDILWLDFDPNKGKEIDKYRPAFVLSAKAYQQQTNLMICMPISTRIRGGLTEVPVTGLQQPSVIATSIIQTLAWPERKVKFIKKAGKETLDQVLQRFLPLIGVEGLF